MNIDEGNPPKLCEQLVLFGDDPAPPDPPVLSVFVRPEEPEVVQCTGQLELEFFPRLKVADAA